MTLLELTQTATAVCSVPQLLWAHDRMPCSITDGPQEPEDVNPELWPEEDADDAYDRARQERIDDLRNTLEDIAREVVDSQDDSQA